MMQMYIYIYEYHDIINMFLSRFPSFYTGGRRHLRGISVSWTDGSPKCRLNLPLETGIFWEGLYNKQNQQHLCFGTKKIHNRKLISIISMAGCKATNLEDYPMTSKWLMTTMVIVVVP